MLVWEVLLATAIPTRPNQGQLLSCLITLFNQPQDSVPVTIFRCKLDQTLLDLFREKFQLYETFFSKWAATAFTSLALGGHKSPLVAFLTAKTPIPVFIIPPHEEVPLQIPLL